MSVLALFLAVSLGVGAALEYRRRGVWQFLVVGALAAASVVIEIVVGWPDLELRLGVTEAILIALVTVVALDLIGLPGPISRRTGIGLRSRAWEFDRHLYDLKRDLDRVIEEYPVDATWDSYRRWKDRVLPTGRRITERMKALRPPDSDWATLRDDYVELYEEILGRFARDEPPDESGISVRGTQLRDRGEVLRARYRAAARAFMRGETRR